MLYKIYSVVPLTYTLVCYIFEFKLSFMAVNYSKNLYKLAQKTFYGSFYYTGEKQSSIHIIRLIINKILIFYFNFKVSLINKKRVFFRISNFFKIKKKNSTSNFQVNIYKNLIEKYSKKLKEENYVFIENFLNEEFYKNILENWPDSNNFIQTNKITKFYSVGFKFLPNKKNSGFDLEKNYFFNNNEIKNIYSRFLSNEFKNTVNNLINDHTNNYTLVEIVCTIAKNKSYLIPHVDSVSEEDLKNTFNFIYFIDGCDIDPKYSGATGIYMDNEFKNPIFIPNTLKNSCLIYNSSSKFFHGFEKIATPNNVTRKTINFHFTPTSS